MPIGKHATGKHRAPRTTLSEKLARIIRPQPKQPTTAPIMEAETVLLPRIT